VFVLLVQGKPHKQIAHELGISDRTVKLHRHQVVQKLHVRSLAELAVIAERLGLLPESRGEESFQILKAKEEMPFPKGQILSCVFSVIVSAKEAFPYQPDRSADSRFMHTQKKIVAVVDDDPSMLNAAESLLDAHGFTTMKFPSAEEFLGSGDATRTDCLLVD